MPLFARNGRKRVRAIPHLCHPIMPVANRLGSGFVRIDGGQLGKRDGHLTPLPMDQHEHVGGAAVFRRHTSYFDSVSFAERRDDFGSDALGLEGKSDFVIEIVIPAQRLLIRPVVRDTPYRATRRWPASTARLHTVRATTSSGSALDNLR